MDDLYKTTKLKMHFVQDPDGNDSVDQELSIHNEDCGGGDYYVIKTKRWAFENIDDLIKILNEFKTKHDLIK
jgi:hypothetical protein